MTRARRHLPALTVLEPVPKLDAHDRRALAENPRPRTRAECKLGPRPCPWLGCKHHLGLDVNHVGSVRVLDGWDDGRDSCVLDVADRAPVEGEWGELGYHRSLEAIGALLGITRERVRQIEVAALAGLNEIAPVLDLSPPEYDHSPFAGGRDQLKRGL